MMKSIYSVFIRGLLVVLPMIVTVFLLVWVTSKVESLFGDSMQSLLGEWYFPGFGILFTILLILLVGVLVSNYVTRNMIAFFVKKFESLPVIKTVYRPIKDFVGLLGGSEHNHLKRVVIFNYNENIQMIGLVTRDDFDDLPAGHFTDEHIAVYIPFSYIFGGTTVFVKRSMVKEIDIAADFTLRSAITGWIKNNSDEN
ncbi:MAG: DUF502 domain-containing protein [Bacteriovoracaceae bacterium]|nr:DUF502 domain-containing protein [Bacteriovoracaceae bacterium]